MVEVEGRVVVESEFVVIYIPKEYKRVLSKFDGRLVRIIIKE